MAVIPAVVTNGAREWWIKLFGGLAGVPAGATIPNNPPTAWNPVIAYFKVGEGGWIDPGGGAEPRAPEPDLVWVTSATYPDPFPDIDAAVDITRDAAAVPTRYGATSRATFTKAVTFTDVSFIAPSTIEIECLLDFGDFNDDGNGNSPEMWEIGVYMDHPEFAVPVVPAGPPSVGTPGLMVAYGTFPKQVKDATKQILNLVRIVIAPSP